MSKYMKKIQLKSLILVTKELSLNSRIERARNHPLIVTEWPTNHLEVLSRIGSIYTYYDGKEWERDSAEIDEDRKTYVCM